MEKYSIVEKKLLLMALKEIIAQGEHSKQRLICKKEVDALLNLMQLLGEKLKKDVKKIPF